jgi:uncharacterized OB-fold protein
VTTVPCRECGQVVSPGDRTCHNCGAPAPALSARIRTNTKIVLTVVLIIIVGAIALIVGT